MGGTRSGVLGLVGAACLLFGSGCSTSRFAVGAMTPVLENTVETALRSDDPILVGEALPTSLLLLEGMVETDPGNHQMATLASMLYFAYAFGYVEPDDPVRASRLYARGVDLAWHALGDSETADAIRAGTFDEVRTALAGTNEDDAEPLMWAAANWGMWIQLNLSDPSAVADFARLLPTAERVAELDEMLFWGMPRILLGALHASRPRMLGGDPGRAFGEFERAFEISDRNMHLAHVFFAKTYCLQTFDAGAWESTLREVIDSPPGILPEAELLNRIARIQAEALHARTAEIFE